MTVQHRTEPTWFLWAYVHLPRVLSLSFFAVSPFTSHPYFPFFGLTHFLTFSGKDPHLSHLVLVVSLEATSQSSPAELTPAT
jgi:hypothetical protein